jgi:hypothetical protein
LEKSRASASFLVNVPGALFRTWHSKCCCDAPTRPSRRTASAVRSAIGAGDATSFSREVAEAALAHAAGDETELAYRRSDALAKRRKLMEAWATYCGAAKPVKSHSRP